MNFTLIIILLDLPLSIVGLCIEAKRDLLRLLSFIALFVSNYFMRIFESLCYEIWF